MSFLQRNSRPLDYLLWEHAQGRDRRDAVLGVLAAYQNEDGGFAWAIEPDNFSERSTPMGTWQATTVLRRIDCYDRSVPLLAQTIDYLLITRRPDGGWDATVPATGAYPRATWCEGTEPQAAGWCLNPTAALLGFLLRVGLDVRRDVVGLMEGYIAGGPISGTELPCVRTLSEDLEALGLEPPAGFRGRITEDVEARLEPERQGLRACS